MPGFNAFILKCLNIPEDGRWKSKVMFYLDIFKEAESFMVRATIIRYWQIRKYIFLLLTPVWGGGEIKSKVRPKIVKVWLAKVGPEITKVGPKITQFGPDLAKVGPDIAMVEPTLTWLDLRLLRLTSTSFQGLSRLPRFNQTFPRLDLTLPMLDLTTYMN